MTQTKTRAPARETQQASPPAEVQEGLRYVAPRCDIHETPDDATILVDLPGVGSEGLSLEVEEDVLVLTARPTGEAQQGRTVWSEWAPVNFHRTFFLSPEADRDAIDATLRQGVLRIRVPKVEQAKPRRITVKGA